MSNTCVKLQESSPGVKQRICNGLGLTNQGQNLCASDHYLCLSSNVPTSCTGTTTVAKSPFGEYANENPKIYEITKVTFPKIKDINAPVTFTLDLGDGLGVRGFTGGAFEGSELSLQGTSPPAGTSPTTSKSNGARIRTTFR